MKKILVIDDEEPLRELVRFALTDRGYRVIEASNGTDGIEMARNELPDLILCDVRMERVDGYLTLSTLHNEPATATIPFILMTGLADTAGMRHGMELGADDYLPKPFTIEALYAAVEARLKRADAAREQAEKTLVALRDNISLMLPHEMLTPLNGIIGLAELLRTSADSMSPAEVAEMGGEICESGRRLQRMVDNFLVFVQSEIAAANPSRARDFPRRRTPEAQKPAEACLRACAAAAGRETDLELSLSPVSVLMAEEYWRKIVEELAQNAFKFSKPGTRVRVTLSGSPSGPVLTVKDHGCGLSPDEIARIGAYMQFKRDSREQQGAGLGLVIIKRIIEIHGGMLAITSHEADGTTVTVSLPSAG